MVDKFNNVYLYLNNITNCQTDEYNLKSDVVTPAITFSIFDKTGKTNDNGDEVGDSVITKEEFNAVSKEEYEAYCKAVKTEIEQNPKDPLDIAKENVRRYAREEGIYNEEYIQKLESEAKTDGIQREDLTKLRSVDYDVLKKYVNSHYCIDFKTLQDAQIRAEKSIRDFDKDGDGLISKKENKALYKSNGKKPLDYNSLLNYHLNIENEPKKKRRWF